MANFISWEAKDNEKLVTFENKNSGMVLRVTSGLVTIAPKDDCEDYLEKCDMMTTAIFAYALYAILEDAVYGRESIRTHFTKQEAAWFLGWLNLTLADKEDIFNAVNKQ